MHRKAYGITIAFAVMLLALGCKSQDRRITDDIKHRLMTDATLSSAKIDVSTHDGVVTLDGKVIGHAESDRATEIAHSVSGVREVKNELTIDTHITNKDIRQRVEQGEDAAKKQNQEQQTQHQ